MNFATEASKLLTNRYFLYFMVFLASTNVLGYLVTNKRNALIFFALVSLLTYQFSKNMVVILLMANRLMREGLENQTTEPIIPALNQIENKDKDIANAISAVQKSKPNEQSYSQNKSSTNEDNSSDKIIDPNNGSYTVEQGPTGAGQSVGNRKQKTTNENFGPRLDYAATIEQSYQNLDNILGSDSIMQLTTDTQKLMKQQQNLFNTMNQMVPVLEGAQNMLKGINVGGLADTLKNMTGLTSASIPSAITNK
jgi:hypothetical protein